MENTRAQSPAGRGGISPGIFTGSVPASGGCWASSTHPVYTYAPELARHRHCRHNFCTDVGILACEVRLRLATKYTTLHAARTDLLDAAENHYQWGDL